jgi:hypothetical protein
LSELTLTDRESRRLKQLEKNISDAGGTMYESLRAIHDEKLYREQFSTWEAYCAERWRMSRQWCYRIIEHGRILALLNESAPGLSPMGDIPERATREVAALPDAQKVEVIREVAAETNGKVTAAAVREEVSRRTTPEVFEAESVVLDELKRPVPKHLAQKHELAARIKSAATKLDAVKKEVNELVDLAGGVFLPLQQIEIALKDVKGLISHARYYTECPRCKGKPKDSCDRCHGHGFLPFSMKGTLSAEDKAWLGVE